MRCGGLLNTVNFDPQTVFWLVFSVTTFTSSIMLACKKATELKDILFIKWL